MILQLNRQFTLLILSVLLFSKPVDATGPYSITNGTASDKGTGLEWQNNEPSKTHTWQDALAYCETLSLDEKTDWRMPNIRELKSLTDYKRYYPAIDPVLSSHSSCYWSSTTVANDAHQSAWVVFFGNGDDLWKAKTESYHVRCVRTLLRDSNTIY